VGVVSAIGAYVGTDTLEQAEVALEIKKKEEEEDKKEEGK